MQKILLFIFIFTASLNMAKAGQEGHGGDIIVSEFLILASEVSESLQSLHDYQMPVPTFPTDYDDAVRKTRVTSEDRVFLGGIEVDAINFPSLDNPRIIVGRERWLDDRIKTIQKKRLVLHEYLSIMGYDDSQYEISHKIIKSIVEMEGDSAQLLPFNVNYMEESND